MKLRPDDRKAIDLVLDRATASVRGNAQAIYAAADGALLERVAGVETLLHALDWWHASEPPRDLVNRTIDRIDYPSSRRHRAASAIVMSEHHPIA